LTPPHISKSEDRQRQVGVVTVGSVQDPKGRGITRSDAPAMTATSGRKPTETVTLAVVMRIESTVLALREDGGREER
jgi:hypothetical protein